MGIPYSRCVELDRLVGKVIIPYAYDGHYNVETDEYILSFVGTSDSFGALMVYDDSDFDGELLAWLRPQHETQTPPCASVNCDATVKSDDSCNFAMVAKAPCQTISNCPV